MKTHLMFKALFACFAWLTGTAAYAVTDADLRKYVEAARPRWEESVQQIDRIINNPPDKYVSDTWQDLTRKAGEGKGLSALNTAADPHNANELEVYSVWLRWKVLHQADGRYAYAYAANLRLKQDDKGDYDYEMAVYIYLARLALAVNGAQCADGSDADRIIAGYESQDIFKQMLKRVDKLAVQQRLGAMAEAIAMESALGERAGVAWLCRVGPGSIEAAQKGDFGSMLKKLPPEQSPDYIGGKNNYYSFNVEPKMLDADQRKQARSDVLTAAIERLVSQMNGGQ